MRARGWQLRAGIAGAATAFALWTSMVGAWESTTKWSVHVVPYWINPVNDDVTNAQAIAAIRFGADVWTDQTAAAFRFAYQGTTTLKASLSNDGKNVVSFSNGGGSAHATAYTFYNPATMIIQEADIVFWQDSYDYIAGSTPCTKPQVYIENVAVHEFGHCLGLAHSDIPTSSLWPTSPACDKSRYQLDADDIAGAEALYPCAAASECNDADVCTTDACQSKKCLRTPIAGCCTTNAQCNDSKPCTTDTCASNKCSHAVIADCCTTNAQCNDSKPCTSDTCVSNKCSHAAIADCCTTNAQCNDSKPCTTDTCASNKCTHAAVANCCTTNAQCNDNKPCTTDTCVSNECAHATVANCCTTNGQCDDGDACTTDVCQSTSCVNTPIAGCGQSDGGQDGSAADGSTKPDGAATPEGGSESDGSTATDAGKPESGALTDAQPDRDAEAVGDSAGDAPVGAEGGSAVTRDNSDTDGGCACDLAARGGASSWGPMGGMTALALSWLSAKRLRRRSRRVGGTESRNEC